MAKPPTNKWRSGQFQITIWENDIIVNNVPIKKVTATLTKSWKDKSGTWDHREISALSGDEAASSIASRKLPGAPPSGLNSIRSFPA